MPRLSWATLGLVLLAVAAGALAFAALRAASSAPDPAPTPSASALTTPSGSPGGGSGGTSGGGSGGALPPVVEPPLLLTDAGVAYRGSTGSCLGGATLQRSADGGARWRPAATPAAAIVDLRDTGASLLLVGADAGCTLLQWTSTDGGATWSAPSAATGVFARLPGSARQIATPSGPRPNPCPVRAVAPVSIEQISDTAAAVLCDGGTLLTTGDGGARWAETTPVPGAQALAVDGSDLAWVLVRDSGVCPGYQLQRTVDAGGSWQLGGCVGDGVLPDERSRPSLAFADPEVGLADLAGRTYATSDAGLTWRPAR